MLIIVSGPSGVGKNRLIDLAASRLNFEALVPFTSRPRRKDEISGRDYHYVRKEEFRDLIVSNQLFEWDYTLRNYYGCPNSIVQMAESTSPTIMHALARMAVRIAVRLPCVSLVFLSSHSQATLSERLGAPQLLGHGCSFASGALAGRGRAFADVRLSRAGC